MRGRKNPAAGLSLFVGLLQTRNVELDHLQEGLHHTVRFLGVLVLQHLGQQGGNDLPRETKPVFQPAALPLLPAVHTPAFYDHRTVTAGWSHPGFRPSMSRGVSGRVDAAVLSCAPP